MCRYFEIQCYNASFIKAQKKSPKWTLMGGEGFEPPKLTQQIYSLPSLAAREPPRTCSYTIELWLLSQEAKHITMKKGVLMKKRLVFVLMLLVALVPTTMLAEGFFDDVSLESIGVDTHQDILKGYVPTYLNLVLGYSGFEITPEGNTTLLVGLGGGYISPRFDADAKGKWLPDWKTPANNRRFNEGRVDWALGMRQGLLWDPDTFLNTLDITALYFGSWSKFTPVKGSTPLLLAEQKGTLIDNSLMLRTHYKDQKVDLHELAQGFEAEFGLSWHIMRYARMWGAVEYALPLYDLTDETEDLKLAFMLTTRAAFSYMMGQKKDAMVHTDYHYMDDGPMKGIPALGGVVRGFQSKTFAGEFMGVANLDLRMNFLEMGIPGLYWYLNPFMDLGVATRSGERHALLSVGANLGLSIIGIVQPGFQIAYRAVGRRPGDSAMHYGFSLKWHY